MGVEYRLLGPLEVERDGALVDLGGRRQRAVLVRLLLSAGEQVPVDRLIDDVWAGAPPRQALSTLRGYISHLRRALGGGGQGPTPIMTRSQGYVLQLGDGDRIDAVELARLVDEAAAAATAGQPDAAEQRLRQARALWRGAPLADVADEPFALAEAHRLSELRLRADEQLLEVQLAQGRHAAAVPELERLVAQHPHRERLRGLLMLALYRSGRQRDALECYARGRAALVEDLGVDPGPALQRLHGQILAQDPALDGAEAGPTAGVRGPVGPTASEIGPAADADVAVAAEAAPLVNRAEELAALDGALEDIQRGARRCVLLGGEPGIGKTRLLGETAARAAGRGALVLWGRCLDGLGAPPFWPWIEVVRELTDALGRDEVTRLAPAGELGPLAPELGAPAPDADSETARFRLFDATTRLLRAVSARRRIVVLLEDLHWADGASLDLLRFLVLGAGVPGLLLAGSYRDSEVTGDHPLRPVLAQLARGHGVRRLPLRPLTTDDVARYLVELTGAPAETETVTRLTRLTGGNPFFVGEVVRLLERGDGLGGLADAAVPANVGDVLSRRLEQLPAGAQLTLVQASYHPDAFAAADVAALREAPLDEVLDDCEGAVAAKLLVEGAEVGTYRFAHALVREQLQRDVPALRRALVHGRVGDLLAATVQGEDDDRIAAAAWHYAQAAPAGRVDEAISWSVRAAELAGRRLGAASAAAHLRRALAVADAHRPDDLTTRADLARNLAVACRDAGDLGAARTAAREAVDLARRLGDPVRIAKIAFRSGGGGLWGIWSDDGEADRELIGWIEEVLDALPADSPWRAGVMARLAAELAFTDEVERRERLAEEAVALGDRIGDTEVLLSTRAMRRLARWSQENTAWRLADADDMVRRTRDAHPFSAAISRHVRMVDQLESGLLAASDASLHEVEALAAEAGRHGLLVQLAWNRAMRAVLAGRFAQAKALADTAAQMESSVSPAAAQAHHDACLAEIRIDQGRAGELLDGLRAHVAEGGGFRWRVLLLRALVEVGDDAASTLLDDLAADAFASMPPGVQRPTFVAHLAVACAVLQAGGPAAALARLVRPWTSTVLVTASGHAAHGALDRVRGLLAAAEGRLDEAIDLHEAGLAVNRAIDARPFVARSCVELAPLLLRRERPGDGERGRALLAEGRDLAAELGMRAVIAAAESAAGALRRTSA